MQKIGLALLLAIPTIFQATRILIVIFWQSTTGVLLHHMKSISFMRAFY